MNAAHMHLLLNHFPLVGFVFSLILLSVGLFRANDGYIKAGILVILISGLLAVPTYLLGEPAEKVIKSLPGFSERLVENHEEAAELAIWCIGATMLAAAVSLWLSGKRNMASKLALNSMLLLNFIALVMIGRTSNLGGKISHSEVFGPSDQNVIARPDRDHEH